MKPRRSVFRHALAAWTVVFVCNLALAADEERVPPWFVGTEITYMEVEAATGGQVTMTINDLDTAGTELSIVDGNGYDQSDFAPRIFAGRHIWRGLSVAARFFRLTDYDAHPPELAPGTTAGANFLTLEANDTIEIETFDAEATYAFTPGPWKFEVAVGSRWARFAAQSEVDAFGVFTSGNFLQLELSNGSSFDGRGYTAGATVEYRIVDSPVYVFAGYRTSDIDGESDSFGRAVGTVAVPPNAPLLGAATVRRNDADETDLEIDEWQVGVRVEFGVGRQAIGFVRATYESQDWTLDGPPTGGAGFGGTLGDVQVNSFSSAGLGGAELAGVSLTTGVRW